MCFFLPQWKHWRLILSSLSPGCDEGNSEHRDGPSKRHEVPSLPLLALFLAARPYPMMYHCLLRGQFLKCSFSCPLVRWARMPSLPMAVLVLKFLFSPTQTCCRQSAEIRTTFVPVFFGYRPEYLLGPSLGLGLSHQWSSKLIGIYSKFLPVCLNLAWECLLFCVGRILEVNQYPAHMLSSVHPECLCGRVLRNVCHQVWFNILNQPGGRTFIILFPAVKAWFSRLGWWRVPWEMRTPPPSPQ